MGTKTIPNLVQGVSQQAAQQRRDSQCEAQVNCMNSPLEGCTPRPHSSLIKVWEDRDLTGSFFQSIVRGTEEYLIGVNAAIPFVINILDGTDCTVTDETSASTYLSSGALAHREKIRAQPVDDFVFLANRQVAVAMASTTEPQRDPEALVFVRIAAADATYTLKITGAVFLEAATGLGSDDLRTTSVAASLSAQINGVSGYSTQLSGSTFRIYRADGADFDVEASDSGGDDYMRAFKEFVPRYTDLPKKGFPGMVLEIRGEDRQGGENYFVKYVGEVGRGTWEETVAPGAKTTLNQNTLPHALVNTGVNTFDYRKQVWSTRIAGSEETAKDPSFVGKAPRDLFYHANRFGILHEGGAVWSKQGNPFTFFPDTLQTVLATAPVDINLVAPAEAQGPALMDLAVSVGEGFYLWAQRTQFRVDSSNEAFRQESVEAPPSTAFEYSPGADPLPLGAALLFTTESGPYSSMRALSFNQGRFTGEIALSDQVPRYIPSGVQDIVGSDTRKVVFVQTDLEPERLYVHNYLLQGQEYVQSAWSYWEVPGGEILWCGIRGNFLRVLQQRGNDVVLLEFDLTPQLRDEDAGATYRTRLDMRLSEADLDVTYDAETGESTFTLPYTPNSVDDLRVVVRDDAVEGGFTRGRVFRVVELAGRVVSVDGDLTPYNFYVGERYSASRKDSPFYLRTDQGPITFDRLTVISYTVEMSDTAYTRVEVQATNKPLRQQEFEGRVLGTATATTGTPRETNRSLKVGVGELNTDVSITLINDTFLPSNWTSAAYEYAGVGGQGAGRVREA